MKKLFLLIFVFISFVNLSEAQKTKKRIDARFVFRGLLFIDYNFYHWQQEAPRTFDASSKNAGQVFNVLPGIGGGFIMGKKTTLLFSLEGTVKYLPFTLDLEGFEGMGSLAFPVLANFRIPIDGFYFLQFGGGVQWSKFNLHQRTVKHQKLENPFFMTYVAEIAGGIEEQMYLLYFLRFGYNTNRAITFDFGLRIGLHGSLWE